MFLLLEETCNTFLLNFADGLKFGYEGSKILSDFTKVLGTYIVECAFREVSNVLLSSCTVLHYHVGVSDINLCIEIINCSLFLLVKHVFVNLNSVGFALCFFFFFSLNTFKCGTCKSSHVLRNSALSCGLKC